MGRTKGAKNRPKGFRVEHEPGVAQAKGDHLPARVARGTGGVRTAGTGVPVADSADKPSPGPVPRPPERERENDVEVLMRKYERGARLLGLSLNEVDRLMGEPTETMSRRKRWTATGIPLTPVATALYQRLIPLTEEYLRADASEDMPDGSVLDIAAIQEAKSGRAKMVLELEKSMKKAGVESADQVSRTIEFTVVLGYFGMEPKEVFEALMERKTRRAVEEFEWTMKGIGRGEEAS